MLDLAATVAVSSECKQKHGAVVTKGGRVISIGVNKQRNDPTYCTDGSTEKSTIYSVHAEIDALSRVKEPEGSIIYIARVTNRGKAFSRPCNNCTKVLIKAKVKAVVYTT